MRPPPGTSVAASMYILGAVETIFDAVPSLKIFTKGMSVGSRFSHSARRLDLGFHTGHDGWI